MKLQKRQENHPQKKEQVSVSSYNRSAYDYVVNGILPYGKFQGKSLHYIITNEQWYLKYMEQEDLLWKWGLLRLKNTQIKTNKPKWDKFLAESTGECWCTIRIISTSTIDNTINADNLPY